MKRPYLLFPVFLGLVLASCETTSSSSNPSSSSGSTSTSEPSSSGEKTYTIKWLNYDGTLLQADNVKEGALPAYKGSDPTHPTEQHYTYTFSGWDKRVNLARKDETYKAKFNKVGESVNISWLDENGSLLTVNENEYGKLPHYPYSAPNKTSEDKRYVFKGWSPELAVIDEEATYTAVYEEFEGETFEFSLENGIHSGWGLPKDKKVRYSFTYDDAYFYGDNKTRNDNFALLSLGLAGFNASKENVKLFLDEISFENVVSSHAYDTNKYDQIAYTFASKEIGDDVVVAIATRGFDYHNEMLANFILGRSGDHKNFTEMSQIIYNDLLDYLTEYIPAGKTIKLWLNGYSRSAAITGFLSRLIYENIEKGFLNKVDVDDIYAYTFEAPTGADVNGKTDYPFIHNYSNSNDMIPLIPPADYGFTLFGERTEIFDENIYELLISLDPDFTVDPFQPYLIDVSTFEKSEDKTAPKMLGEYFKLLLQSAMSIDMTNNYTDLSDRERYDDFFSHVLPTAVEILNGFTFDKVVALAFDLFGKIDTLFLLVLSEDSQAFYEEVKKSVVAAGIELDFVKLNDAMNNVFKLLDHYFNEHLTGSNKVSPINGIVTMLSNIKQIVAMHSYESTYVLVSNLINEAK
ncbi:MAG: hypothetical protein E7178_06060 [Erysipelotrichaceae bacterium]|jgi:hypothetical protein|nr:hypothetical protein [Erysipelotrichaceae bacterium]